MGGLNLVELTTTLLERSRSSRGPSAGFLESNKLKLGADVAQGFLLKTRG